MQPGRELDALVAVQVMGLRREKRKIPCPDGIPGCAVAHYGYFPPFSTDISASWEVVEKLRTMEIYLNVHADKNRYYVLAFVAADTAQEAICKAALLAVLYVS